MTRRKLTTAAYLAAGAALLLTPTLAAAQYHEYNTLRPSVEIYPDGLPPAPPPARLTLTPPPAPSPLAEEISREMEENARAQRTLKPVFTATEDEEDVLEEEQVAEPTRVTLPAPRPDRYVEETEDNTTPATAALPENKPSAKAAQPPPMRPAPAAVVEIDNDTEAMPEIPLPGDLTLAFEGNASDIVPSLQSKLQLVSQQLKDLPNTRLQVRAYATGEDGNTSSARRISLSRALSVRSFLMDLGIKPNRIDVRALGTETERGPLDRVDMLFVR